LFYDDFKAAVEQVLSAGAGAGGGLVPIPLVRKVLAPRVAGPEFDAHLCAMQAEGLIHLLTHVGFEELPDAERQECVKHPSGLVAYWVCRV
jgi:hypothetical protein